MFVGPADLSHSLGVPGQFQDPTYLAALRTVVTACRAHGKAAGILIYDAAALPRISSSASLHRSRLGGLVRQRGARAMLAAAGRCASWRVTLSRG